MGNKIIIDEEVLAKLDARIQIHESKLIDAPMTNPGILIGLKFTKRFILENSTTISIDESIEQNFETLLDAELNKLPYEKHLDDGGYNDGQIAGFERGARFMFDKFATEQSIISEIKSKDKYNDLMQRVVLISKEPSLAIREIMANNLLAGLD
jgi:hypothetical protein